MIDISVGFPRHRPKNETGLSPMELAYSNWEGILARSSYDKPAENHLWRDAFVWDHFGARSRQGRTR